MPLDLREVGGVAEAGGLEEVACVGPQHGQLAELVPVALEVPVVDGVEADQRREQPDVGLGDRVADEVALVGEPVRQPVQGSEQLLVGAVVRLLGTGEPALVDAVVDVGVDALVHLVDLVTQSSG